MLHAGENMVDGVPVFAVRKRIRRINISVSREGAVSVSLPFGYATLREAEEFLRSKWQWVVETRKKALSRPRVPRPPVGDGEKARLHALLDELHGEWTARLGESGVAWRTRSMKSLWGSCHWRERTIVYGLELARAPRELVEYVVVHELTHLKIHGHGARFKAAMDAALPRWRELRSRLDARDGWILPVPVQAEFDFA